MIASRRASLLGYVCQLPHACAQADADADAGAGVHGWPYTQHVYQLVPRPAWAKVSRVLDRTETEQFKRFFDDWAVMIRVRPGD